MEGPIISATAGIRSGWKSARDFSPRFQRPPKAILQSALSRPLLKMKLAELQKPKHRERGAIWEFVVDRMFHL